MKYYSITGLKGETMSINHQNMNLAANYGQQAPQAIFELTNNEQYVTNYLVAPGNICYFLDTEHKKFYEKTYEGTTSYDLANPVVQNRFQQQPAQQGLSDADWQRISDMMDQKLSQYNPHIPKKERKNNE